jgi:hypothetical protein
MLFSRTDSARSLKSSDVTLLPKFFAEHDGMLDHRSAGAAAAHTAHTLTFELIQQILDPSVGVTIR